MYGGTGDSGGSALSEAALHRGMTSGGVRVPCSLLMAIDNRQLAIGNW